MTKLPLQVLFLLGVALALVSAQTNGSFTNPCAAWSLSPLQLSVNVTLLTLNQGNKAMSTRVFFGNLSTGYNIDVLCWQITSNVTCTSSSMTVMPLIEYTDGSYPVSSALPVRFYGNGAFQVPWSSTLLVSTPGTCTGVFTASLAAVPTTQALCPGTTNLHNGFTRSDSQLSSKYNESTFFLLGSGTQISLTCLNVLSQPLNPVQITNCPVVPYSVELVSGPNCIYSNSLLPCCQITDQTTCQLRSCIWSKVEGQCFQIDDSVDITAVSTAIPYEMVFTGRRPLALGTNYPTPNTLRWGIRYRQNSQPGCNTLVSLSAGYNTYGGVCELPVIQGCDSQIPQCLLQQPTIIVGSRYCYCMQQAERCYRLAGCSRSVKYDALIRDCSNQGCGAMCASALSTHTPMISVLILALLCVIALL